MFSTRFPHPRRRLNRGVLFLIFFVLPGAVYPFRPFITDDAGTVEPVTFELETSVDYWKDKASFGACFKHGITSRMDIGVAFGRCQLPKHERGYDPAELLLKFNLIPDRLSTSFSGSFGEACYSAMFIYSQPIKMFTLHANLGYSAAGAALDGDLTFGLAGAVDIHRFTVGAEFGGSQESFDWWQAGIRCAFTDWFAADAAIGGDFNRDMAMNATSGLFFAFPLPQKGE